MAIAELYDPETAIAGGDPASTMGKVVDELRDECGWLVEGIDWICRKVLHFDLIMHAIEPLAGDFQTMSSMQAAWGNVGTALGAVGENYASLASQSASVWKGEAGQQARSRLHDVAQMHADQKEGTGLMQQQLGHMIDVAVETAHCVASGLHLIADILLELAADAAVPVVGWGKALVTGAGKVRQAWNLVHRILEAIENFTRIVKAALRVVRTINTVLAITASLTSFGAAGAHTAAGQQIDDTARHAF